MSPETLRQCYIVANANCNMAGCKRRRHHVIKVLTIKY